MAPDHRYRSPLLGRGETLGLPQGPLEVFRRGVGPPLVFAHGWLANANLWRAVVDRLADRFTCLVLDLPLGSHRVAMPAEADLSPAGCGALIAAAVRELGFAGEAVLVGNDSGGAYTQVALATDPRLARRLVLASCETPYDDFPPPPFDGLPAAAADPAVLGQLLGALRDPAVRVLDGAYGLLVKRPIETVVWDSYALPAIEDDAILRDTAKVMASASSGPIHQAGRHLGETFASPVTFVWPTHDPVFPIDHARRYAAQFADARLVEVDDSYGFIGEDAPEALADAIATG